MIYVRHSYPVPVGVDVPLPSTLGCALPSARSRPLAGFVSASYPLPAGGAVLKLPASLGCADCGGRCGNGAKAQTMRGLGFSWKDTLIGGGIGAGVAALQSVLDDGNSTQASTPSASSKFKLPTLPGITAAPQMLPATNTTALTAAQLQQQQAAAAAAAAAANQPKPLVPWASNNALIVGGAVIAVGAALMLGKRR